MKKIIGTKHLFNHLFFRSITGLSKSTENKPRDPANFVGWVGEPHPETGRKKLAGLRTTGTMDGYLWFCENFMECVITSQEWKLKSRRQKMSSYLTPTLEAFAILMYTNSYEVWNHHCKSMASTSSNSTGDDMSTLSGASSKVTFKYTGDSKGCRKYRGWNSEGMKFYNNLLDLVEFQRQRTGCTFERDL